MPSPCCVAKQNCKYNTLNLMCIIRIGAHGTPAPPSAVPVKGIRNQKRRSLVYFTTIKQDLRPARRHIQTALCDTKALFTPVYRLSSATAMMTVAKKLGERIFSLRKAQKLSQADLAAMASLDRSFISEIENGQKNISVGTLEKIAKALGTSMGSLID